LVDEAGARGPDLIAAWVASKNAAAVFAVASDDGAPAAARKAARRGLNVLKSRGVVIPERPREARVADGPAVEAWFRPPDAAGTSAFTIGSRSKDGRYRLVDIIVQEGVGLVSIAGMQMSRSQLRQTFDGIAGRFGAPPAAVPLGWARFRIASAERDNATSGTPVPLGADSHRDLLGPAPSEPPPHPADMLALGRETGFIDLERTAKLHAEPELRAWLPDPSAMQTMLLAIGQGLPVGAALDHGAARGKVDAILSSSTDAFFTVERQTRIAERMVDAAISMAARGAIEQATVAVAVAKRIRSLAASTPPHTVAFLRAFFEKAFGLATARAAARQGVVVSEG